MPEILFMKGGGDILSGQAAYLGKRHALVGLLVGKMHLGYVKKKPDTRA